MKEQAAEEIRAHTMNTYEYRVVTMKVGGTFRKDVVPASLQSTLDEEGNNGWRLASSFVATKLGDTQAVTLIFVRERQAN